MLDHIALHVVDLKISTRFYQEVIQLDTIPEPFHDGRHTWFTIGVRSQLHLISGAEPGVVHKKNTHLCFRVPSVEKFVIRLIQAKVPFEDWSGKSNGITTRTDGVKQIYFQDPDGWWIEVNDAK